MAEWLGDGLQNRRHRFKSCNGLKLKIMEQNEIKKVLYKERPVAKQVALYRDGGSKDYEAETSIGTIEFHVPITDQRDDNGKSVPFEKEMPGQLLIRWLKGVKDDNR